MIITVKGLRRSGNHGIIYWLLEELNEYDNYIFFNSIKSINDVQITHNTIVSYEDHDLYFEYNKNFKNIIILRDIYNNIASRITTPNGGGRQINIHNYDFIIEKWIEYAENIKKDDFLFINYNEWFSNKKYRDDFLLKNFNILNKDIKINSVSKEGYGSSFNKRKYNNNAQNMQVLERYKNENVQKNEIFKKILKNKKLKELNKNIFGFYINEKNEYII